MRADHPHGPRYGTERLTLVQREAIADLINSRRRELGMSLAAIAAWAGLTPGQVWSLSHARVRRPPRDRLDMIFDALDLAAGTAAEICGYVGYGTAGRDPK